MCFWGAMFLVFYGTGVLLRAVWPTLQGYGDAVTLTALGAACFVSFARNRTLHCGLTGPLFIAAAIVAVLNGVGIWHVDVSVLWGVVVFGVGVAFLVEWRTVRRTARGVI